MQELESISTSSTQRILRREWKRNKPHLPKSTSLPILQLKPSDRPIFSCQQCGFINTLIPLCLWCCWTSAAAHREFELSMPRARRVSAPPRVFWTHPAVSASRSLHASTALQQATTSPLAQPSVDTTRIDGFQTSNRPSRKCAPNVQIIPVTSGDGNSQNCSATYSKSGVDSLTRYRAETNAETVVLNNVARATPPSPVPVSDKPRRPCWSDERVLKDRTTSRGSTRNQPPIRNSLDLRSLRRSLSIGVDRPNTMHLIKTLSTKSLRSTHIVIDFKAIQESYDLIKHDDPSPNDNLQSKPKPKPKTLRRKKGVPLLRVSTPPTAKHALTPDPVVAVPLPQKPVSNPYPDYSLVSPQNPNLYTHSRSQSQPHNTPRLGHPSRPYYTAIRPNMSRPTSAIEPFQSMPQPPQASTSPRPLSLPSPSRAPSPGIFSVLSSTSALSTPTLGDDGPRSSFSYPSASPVQNRVSPRPFSLGGSVSRHRSGFSLSGETELRMALAREQGDVGRESDNAYRFRDMGKKQDTRVMRKVHNLKRGLKELVMRKTL